MKRGSSSGGGQSSLGYLFESNEKSSEPAPPSPPKSPLHPPYGTDMDIETHHPTNHPPSPQLPMQQPVPVHDKNINDQSKGQKLGTFLTERPSTKINAPPGGSSSLGYLFRDK